MVNKLKYFISLILLFLPAATAQAKIESFVYPKVKEAYCGSGISVNYCKCAFHGENCDAVNTDKKGADAKVTAGFQKYVEGRITMFAMSCMNGGGIYSVINKTCEYCTGDKVRSEGVCVAPDEKRSLEEIYNLPKIESEGGTENVGYVVNGEGEFFVFSPGRGKWIGPVRGGLSLFEGDVLFTTENGRAQLRLGRGNTLMANRSMLRLPTPKKERSVLERGALFIWEIVKSVATNTPFEIEGGAHSVAGIKGTKFVMEVEGDVATYSVNEGLVEVWSQNNPAVKLAVEPGGSAQVTASGAASTTYDWDALAAKYALNKQDLSEPTAPKSFATIDPDAVFPPETAYSGDLIGNAAPKKSWPWKWLVALAALAGGVYFLKRRSTGAKSPN